MSGIIHLEPSQVPAHLRLGYNGTKFKACVCKSISVPIGAGQWDSGSRDTYRLIDLQSGRQQDLTGGTRVVLAPGVVVVMASVFMGKESGLTYYVLESDCLKLLPSAKATNLSLHEKLFLYAAVSLRSSYNGKNRYQLAREEWVFAKGKAAGLFPSEREWEAARETLWRAGFVNVRGSITVNGQNALGTWNMGSK